MGQIFLEAMSCEATLLTTVLVMGGVQKPWVHNHTNGRYNLGCPSSLVDLLPEFAPQLFPMYFSHFRRPLGYSGHWSCRLLPNLCLLRGREGSSSLFLEILYTRYRPENLPALLSSHCPSLMGAFYVVKYCPGFSSDVS